MKRDFLKNLGIEDKDIIDKILDENSADIGKAKGELQTYKDKVTELEGKITTKDGEIATLQKKVGDTDALNAQIAQLTTDKTNLTNELNTKVNKIQKDHAIEGGYPYYLSVLRSCGPCTRSPSRNSDAYLGMWFLWQKG